MEATITQLKTLVTQVEGVAKQYGLESDIHSLNTLIEKADKRQINLLVCGEFKRGKSSFINALLNENICPEEVGIATSAISIISYGEKPKVIRHFGKIHEVTNHPEKSKIEQQTEEIAISDIAKFADGTVSDIQNTIMLEIKIPNERLKNGLTLIDTPGVGSLDPRHLFLTLYALPKADIIYYLTEVGEPLQGSELNFYQNRVASTGKVNRILVNQADRKSSIEVEEIIQDIKKKVNNDSVEVLPVSAKLWKEYNADNSRVRALKYSHCKEISEAIQNDMHNCATYLSELVREQFISMLGKLLQSIEIHKKEIEDTEDIQKKKEELQQKLAELKQLRDAVTNQNSDIRKKIAQILKNSQKEVLSKFSEKSVLLSSIEFDKILQSAGNMADGGENYVLSKINEEITHLSEDLDRDINSSIEDTIELVGKDLELSEEHFEGTINMKITPLQQTFSEKAMSMTRQSLPFMGITMTTSMVGAAGVGICGGLIGAGTATIAAVAPYIAVPLGIVAGIAYVVKSIKDSRRQSELANIRQQVSPRLTIALNELRQYIQNRYDELDELLVQSLKDTADQMSKQMQELLESLKQCEAGEQERKAEEKKIESQISFVKGLTTQARVYNTNPFA